MGRRVLRLTATWDLDGYRVASALPLQDSSSREQPGQAMSDASAGAVARAGGDAGSGDGGDGAAGDGEPASGAAAGAGDDPEGEEDNAGSVEQLSSHVIDACEGLLEQLRSALTGRRVGMGQLRDLMDRCVCVCVCVCVCAMYAVWDGRADSGLSLIHV